jgi:methylmalonyl-CoA/ethylmalonyl-CoA epimerase
LRNSPLSGARIAHIGIAVRDIDALISFYSDVLGLAVHPLGNSDGARITGFTAGDALVELLEPAVDESPIGKFIAKRGPGIHHVCFVVDDLAAVLERCRGAGIRLIDEEPRIGAEGKPIAFLHPSSTGGVLIELTEQ